MIERLQEKEESTQGKKKGANTTVVQKAKSASEEEGKSDPSQHLSTGLEDVDLPQETLYMIDKVVRLRTRKGAFGEDYSELINHEKDQERRDKFAHFYKLAENKKLAEESSNQEANDSGKP